MHAVLRRGAAAGLMSGVLHSSGAVTCGVRRRHGTFGMHILHFDEREHPHPAKLEKARYEFDGHGSDRIILIFVFNMRHWSHQETVKAAHGNT